MGFAGINLRTFTLVKYMKCNFSVSSCCTLWTNWGLMENVLLSLYVTSSVQVKKAIQWILNQLTIFVDQAVIKRHAYWGLQAKFYDSDNTFNICFNWFTMLPVHIILMGYIVTINRSYTTTRTYAFSNMQCLGFTLIVATTLPLYFLSLQFY